MRGEVFQLVALILLQGLFLFGLVRHARMGGLQVAAQLQQASRSKRGGIIQGYLREASLEPRGSQGVSRDLHSDAHVVSGEANCFNAMCVPSVQPSHFQQTGVLEEHRIARWVAIGAMLQYHAVLRIASSFLPE